MTGSKRRATVKMAYFIYFQQVTSWPSGQMRGDSRAGCNLKFTEKPGVEGLTARRRLAGMSAAVDFATRSGVVYATKKIRCEWNQLIIAIKTN